MNPVRHWIVVADERTARLLSLQRVPGGRWHAEEHDSLKSRWEDFHEHRHPDALDHGPTSTSHEHFSPGFSEAEVQEEQRRFARDVVHWLEQDRGARGEEWTLFASPGFFGILRPELEKLRRWVDLHEMELTRLRPHELAEHPGVLRAMRIEKRASMS